MNHEDTKALQEILNNHKNKENNLNNAIERYNLAAEHIEELLFTCEGEGVWGIIGLPLQQEMLKIRESVVTLIKYAYS